MLFIPGYTFPVTEYYKADYERLLRSEDIAAGNWLPHRAPS